MQRDSQYPGQDSVSKYGARRWSGNHDWLPGSQVIPQSGQIPHSGGGGERQACEQTCMVGKMNLLLDLSIY